MFRFVVLQILLCLLIVTSAAADSDKIVNFDLRFAGYKLGMNYEEAVLVRPFVRVENVQYDSTRTPLTAGYVDQVFFDGIEFRFRVEFLDGEIIKILGRFPPSQLQQLRKTLFEELGQGESVIKTVTPLSGAEYKLYSDRWEFPSATVYLISSEVNVDFGTLSILSNSVKSQRSQNKNREATGDHSDKN